MKKLPALRELRSSQDYEELVFHVRGLGEAYETVVDLFKKLEAAPDEPSRENDELMGRLEVEIRAHMKYHLDQARPIVKRLVSKHHQDTEKLSRTATAPRESPPEEEH